MLLNKYKFSFLPLNRNIIKSHFPLWYKDTSRFAHFSTMKSGYIKSNFPVFQNVLIFLGIFRSLFFSNFSFFALCDPVANNVLK